VRAWHARPGTAPASWRSIHLTVRQRHQSPSTGSWSAPAALAGRATADGARPGSDFGAVVIAETGSAPCTLSGLIQVAGLSRVGRAVTITFRSRLPASVTLMPHAGPVPEDTGAPSVIPLPPPGLDGAIWLAQRYRVRADSPAGTLCRPAWVTPAAWHVVLPGGLAFSAPNADPGGPDPSSRPADSSPAAAIWTTRPSSTTASR